jgi:transcriptional regulator with GAF, ATPase, and Fis domain
MNTAAQRKVTVDDEGVAQDEAMSREMATADTEGGIVYKSAAMRAVIAQVHHVAPTNSTVLLLGETGVGKEVVAQAIHDSSPRRDRQMVRVSCAAIPSTLIESELFGHERGAFTGALARQIGRFEAAHGSTIFLDEIGDVPLETQVKLLRVLQERRIERLGGAGSIEVNVRIIAATNRDLEEAVRNETFREDLFYRLNVFPITIPPLRARVGDIPALVWRFVDELSPRLGKTIAAISTRSLADFQTYAWPGNVRELRNVIEREMILTAGPILTPSVPRPRQSSHAARSLRLVDVQADHIKAVLDSCGWRIRGTSGAAEQLGIKPTTLESRMAKLGLRKNDLLPTSNAQ